MSAKEFIDDIKEMFKTKDTTKVNEKYVQPALETAKEVSIKTKDFVVENTPKVIEAAKVGVEKTKALIQSFSKKEGTNTTTSSTTTTTTTTKTKDPDSTQ